MPINKKNILFSVLIFLILEIIIRYNGFFYYGSALIFFSLIIYEFYLSRKGKNAIKHFLYYLIPIFYFASYLFFIVFISGRAATHLLSVMSSFLLYSYLSVISTGETDSSEKFFDSNLSNIILLLAGFYWFSALSAARSFLGVSLWILALISALYGTILVLTILFVNKIRISSNIIYLILISIISVQLFWVFSFLPYNFINIGFIALLIIYYYTYFFKKHLSGGLTFKNVKNNLIFGFACLLALLLTAKWM